jgi:heme-degrading monooxygenase HmoA
MIHEIAIIDVSPGMEAGFEVGVRTAAPLFERAQGCRGLTLQREIERPSRYRLYVAWDTVEDHTLRFRGSSDFQTWRQLVSHCFAKPPEVSHVATVLAGG